MDAVARYRHTVEERRGEILGEMGIDASLLEDPARLEAAVETLKAGRRCQLTPQLTAPYLVCFIVHNQ